MATKKLSTTSYAVLGLLNLRDWSAYELVQQMDRGVGIMWSFAPSTVYVEAKNLVAHRLATARFEQRGERRRTVYRVTPKGRKALTAWLTEPGAEPQLQFEGWLKVLFADIGRPDDTRATIAEARAWAERVQSQGRRVAADYLDGTYLAGTVPIEDRAHVLPLTFALLWDLADLVRRWSDWADEHVDRWSSADPSAPLQRGPFEVALTGRPTINR